MKTSCTVRGKGRSKWLAFWSSLSRSAGAGVIILGLLAAGIAAADDPSFALGACSHQKCSMGCALLPDGVTCKPNSCAGPVGSNCVQACDKGCTWIPSAGKCECTGTI